MQSVDVTNIKVYTLAWLTDMKTAEKTELYGKLAINSDEGLLILDGETGDYFEYEPGPIGVNELLFERKGETTVLMGLDGSKLVPGALVRTFLMVMDAVMLRQCGREFGHYGPRISEARSRRLFFPLARP